MRIQSCSSKGIGCEVLLSDYTCARYFLRFWVYWRPYAEPNRSSSFMLSRWRTDGFTKRSILPFLQTTQNGLQHIHCIHNTPTLEITGTWIDIDLPCNSGSALVLKQSSTSQYSYQRYTNQLLYDGRPETNRGHSSFAWRPPANQWSHSGPSGCWHWMGHGMSRLGMEHGDVPQKNV